MRILTITLLFLLAFGFQINGQTFEVSYKQDVLKDNFSGNILLYLSKENKSPKDVFVGLELIPVYRIVVNDLKANEVAIFNDNAISYPVELSNIERGEYYVQVVFDRNLGDFNIGTSWGNLYSDPIRVDLTKRYNEVFKIEAEKIVPPIPFKGTAFLQELSVKSRLLSDFHNKDILVNAAVVLPEGYYENPNQQYPVVYSIFGFGANYKLHAGLGKYKFTALGDHPVITVYLDGNCPEGHSTYANSDINGPWGDALVEEFIPALQKKYRTNKSNFLFGHSSGGWSSLWLQINYPKVFSGTWSSSPDQVDFRNYQNKNIYETKNMFYDDEGNLLADVTIAGRFTVISAKDFYRTEHVIYRGSQMHSFDAVFGSYDKNGKRIRLVNLPNGEVNQTALPLWKRYDLSIKLRENWDSMKGDLEDKIRISVGTSDNFHLNHSVELLENEMKKLNAAIEFQYYPGDHFTLFTEVYHKEGLLFLEKCYNRWLMENN